MLENYEEIWRTLADLARVMQERGERIPREVMRDLKSAKTLITIFRMDPSQGQIASRIETYLDNVEMRLIYAAETKFGKELAERWIKKLSEARTKSLKPKPISVSKFIPALLRDKRWVRIRITEDIRRDRVESIAAGLGLSFKMQEDGYLLVYGEEKGIKKFIKGVANEIKRESSLSS